jgi:hypothetical protein
VRAIYSLSLALPACCLLPMLLVGADVSLDWPLTRFGVFGHCGTYTGSFCVFGPVLSSPAARGAASLAMALRRIEVVFVLWDVG